MNTMRHVVVGASLSVLLPCALARADIKVCNNFRAPISLAIAYEDNGSATSEGWWKVQPGVCSDIKFSGLDFYYTAESDSYRQGNATGRDNWGKGQQFYVGGGKFKFDNALRARRGARLFSFGKVAISDSFRGRDFTVTLRFRSGSTDVETKSK